jgi:hypothetical protein
MEHIKYFYFSSYHSNPVFIVICFQFKFAINFLKVMYVIAKLFNYQFRMRFWRHYKFSSSAFMNKAPAVLRPRLFRFKMNCEVANPYEPCYTALKSTRHDFCLAHNSAAYIDGGIHSCPDMYKPEVAAKAWE